MERTLIERLKTRFEGNDNDIEMIVKTFFDRLSHSVTNSSLMTSSSLFLDDLFVLMFKRQYNNVSQEYAKCLQKNQEDINPFGQRIPQAIDSDLQDILDPLRVLESSLTTLSGILSRISRDIMTSDDCPSSSSSLTRKTTCRTFCVNVVAGTCLSRALVVNGLWKKAWHRLERLLPSLQDTLDQGLSFLSQDLVEAVDAGLLLLDFGVDHHHHHRRRQEHHGHRQHEHKSNTKRRNAEKKILESKVRRQRNSF